MRIRSAALSSLAAFLVALAPVHAVAQEANQGVRDRPRADYDPLGLRLGGFMLNAGVNLYANSTDNVFATETNAQEDIGYSMNPYAQLNSNWSRHAVSVSAGATFNRFQDFSSEDTESNYIGGYGRLDIGRNTAVSASGRLANETEPRTAPDAGGLAAPVEFQRQEGEIAIEHTINRFRLTGMVGANETTYDGLGQGFRDRTENYVGGRVAVAISPRLQILGDARFDEREYENDPTLDSDGRTLAAGVRMNLTGLLSGEVTVGQFEREYATQTVDGVAFAGNVQWFVTPITTVSLHGRRDVEETGAAGAATYVASDVGVRVDHELRRNIILSGGIGRVQRDYEAPTDRQDDATYGDIGVEYTMNRRVALEARYERFNNSSDGLNRDRDFEVNNFVVGVKLRL